MSHATLDPVAPPRAGVGPEYDNLAEVLHALGDILLSRILWNPRPGTATEADQLRYRNGAGVEKRRVELIDGVLVEKAMGTREGGLEFVLIGYLHTHIRLRNLGVGGSPSCIFRTSGGNNRMPDISFTPWSALPSDDAHLQPVSDYAPALAVEGLSDSNTPREMARKRRDLFASGTRLIWEFDPVARTVAVYADPTSPDAHRLLTAADTLVGDPVLPGFVLPLAELFAEPQLNPRPAPEGQP